MNLFNNYILDFFVNHIFWIYFEWLKSKLVEIWADTGLLLDFISLVVTTVLTISIFYLQKKHETEVEEIKVLNKQKELEEKARIFMIENNSELDYIPWCIFASNVGSLKNHTRKIYREYCKCSIEVQNEILKRSNIHIEQFQDTTWIDRCIERLQKDIKEYDLGYDMLYDGAKYFHRSLNNYYNHTWRDIENNRLFDPIVSRKTILGMEKTTLQGYIDEYLYCKFGGEKYEGKKDLMRKPLDYLCDEIDFGMNSEHIICGWCMEMIYQVSLSIAYNCVINKRNNGNFDDGLPYTDAQVDTYEDKYYETLHVLFNTYNSTNFN